MDNRSFGIEKDCPERLIVTGKLQIIYKFLSHKHHEFNILEG